MPAAMQTARLRAGQLRLDPGRAQEVLEVAEAVLPLVGHMDPANEGKSVAEKGRAGIWQVLTSPADRAAFARLLNGIVSGNDPTALADIWTIVSSLFPAIVPPTPGPSPAPAAGPVSPFVVPVANPLL